MEQRAIKILICVQDSQTERFLKDSLDSEGYAFQLFEDIEEAIQQTSPGEFHALLLGLSEGSKEGRLDGLRAIPILRKIDPYLPIIVIAHDDSLEVEREARMAGVFYYLLQPLEANEVRMSVVNAVHKSERLFGDEKMGVDSGRNL